MRTWFRRLFKGAGASRPTRRSTRPTRRSARLSLEGLEDRCVLSSHFLQTNLVSDIPGLAATTDLMLINPWGLTASPSTPGHPGSAFWVSDNQTGFSTLYNGAGVKQGLVVLIPNVSGTFTHATPTGTVFDTDPNAADFQVHEGTKVGHSVFLFATLDGTIDGWAPSVDVTHALVAVTGPKGAIYTGLAIDTPSNASNTLLYAADWGTGQVEVYNTGFQQVDVGAFQDKAIPNGFRPFNVQDINGHIWVTYAQFDPTTGADTGTGGFVDEFTRDGVLERHISSPKLNSPWGLALAPAGFGDFGGALLVGGFGDGHINAFDPNNGHFLGTLKDPAGKPITIEDLWALRFGNDGAAGSSNTLFFTAGVTDAPQTNIFGATDGLLGSLQAIPHLSRKASIVPHLSDPFPQGPAFQQFSTVPANGDQNPYGVAFVPKGFPTGGKGGLQPGDILVSNFNNAQNQQGTGTTIVRIGPNGQHSVFFQDTTTQGLTTALGVLRKGFVIVGNLPTNAGALQSPQPPGELRFLDADGKVVLTLQDPKLLDGPWDLAVNDQGDHAQVFVANVLSGTVTRIDLEIEKGKIEVESMTQIASGFKHEPNDTALVVGPTGLAFDRKTDTLYVASTDDNAVFAIHDAADTTKDQGKGAVVFADQTHLHGPLGLVLAPNGDLITVNGDAVNPDPTQPSELVEFTPKGQFVGQFSIDSLGTGAAFGVAATDAGGVLRLAAVNDGSGSAHDPNTNTLEVWTFQTGGLDG
jgi:uncharacterized protein (TIGR03118 family)